MKEPRKKAVSFRGWIACLMLALMACVVIFTQSFTTHQHSNTSLSSPKEKALRDHLQESGAHQENQVLDVVRLTKIAESGAVSRVLPSAANLIQQFGDDRPTEPEPEQKRPVQHPTLNQEKPISLKIKAALRRARVESAELPLQATPPVIVGGTDGSGTRGAVSFLLSSGVLMLADAGGASDCQYDVHGKELNAQGWPPVVQRVLSHTHSPDYDPGRDLPNDVQESTRRAVKAMANAFRRRVEAKLSRETDPAFYTRWGFKAPVSMYMLPFWAEEFPNCTFIQVVRDGRDMVFHWLQSPVKRYWPHLFPQSFGKLPLNARGENQLIPLRGHYIGKAYLYNDPKLNLAPHLRIAELWAKSNSLVESAGTRLATDGRHGDFNFVTVRSEDFVSTEREYRSAAADLLSAVHAGMRGQDLCCLVGEHWRAEHRSASWTKSAQNYGKWRAAIDAYGGTSRQDPKSFYALIMERMESTLEHFGYLSEPWEHAFEPLDCGSINEGDCPQRPAHKQRCMD